MKKLLLVGFCTLISFSSYASMFCIEVGDLTKSEIAELLKADHMTGVLLKNVDSKNRFPSVIKYYRDGLDWRNGSVLQLVDEISEDNFIAIYDRPERELRLACILL